MKKQKRPERVYLPVEWTIFWGIIAVVILIIAAVSYLVYRVANSPRPSNTSPVVLATPMPAEIEIGVIPLVNGESFRAWYTETNPERYAVEMKDAKDTKVSATYVSESSEWVDGKSCYNIPDPFATPPALSIIRDCREHPLTGEQIFRLSLALAKKRSNLPSPNPPKK